MPDRSSRHLEQRALPFRRQALEGGLASIMPHFEHSAHPQPRPSQLVAPGACWPDDGLRQFVKERAKRPQPRTAGNLATATGQGTLRANDDEASSPRKFSLEGAEGSSCSCP